MKDIIKQTLDEFISHSKQINLDSEAARVILSEQIAERIQLWQKQKEVLVFRYIVLKVRRDLVFTLRAKLQNLKIVEITKRHIEGRVDNPTLFCLLIFIY